MANKHTTVVIRKASTRLLVTRMYTYAPINITLL